MSRDPPPAQSLEQKALEAVAESIATREWETAARDDARSHVAEPYKREAVGYRTRQIMEEYRRSYSGSGSGGGGGSGPDGGSGGGH
ncbi:hypothetical protein HZB02_05905 [Candidatus Woesearchaeota archaeon]|nr:hypothetical protein [Candidatus Woesearchaeota archaeon]